MKNLYILDAVNFLFRAYYAIGPISNPKGEPTGALYGFIRSVFKLINECAPSHLICVFDGPESTKSRKEVYSDYKIHRAGMPDDLFFQLGKAIAFCEIAGIPALAVPGVEADDVIGSIAKWSGHKHIPTYICSSDKDLCQLVNDSVFVMHIHKGNQIVDKEKVKELFGVAPHQIIDYLALMGDASDNIPGLEGIGPKTAALLLNEFGTLKNLLDHPEQVTGKRQEVIREGKATALLSQELATIHTGIAFPQEEEFFRLKEPQIEKVKAFYQEMHFLSLLKELNAPEVKREELTHDFGVDEREVHYILINHIDELKKVCTELKDATELCIDTETTSVHPMEAELVGLGLSDRPKRGWYIPFNGAIDRHEALHVLKPFLENRALSVFGHNLKYDLHILRRVGINPPQISFDTMLASHLLEPHKKQHGLDALSLEHFGKVKIPITDLIGKGQSQITMKEVPLEQAARYCCEDVDYTFRLKTHFAPLLREAGLQDLFATLELPLLFVLMKMEETGIYLDVPYLESIRIPMEAQLSRLTEEIFTLAGESFNLNSPKQLGALLFEKLGIRPAKKTATGSYSTSADVLEELKGQSPIIAKILEYRSLEKLRSTYVEALPAQINARTGRIHCSFNQSGTATGRLSCQDPNLQNIPVRTEEGKKIRTAFRPQQADWCFLSADYSQIELRLLAHLSEDPALLKAFEKGEDIHRFTASLVYDLPLREVTPTMRHAAKAVNFGILYGQQAFGLSQELSISVEEAKTLIQTYFDRYKKVETWLAAAKQSVRTLGYSTTLYGRKRPIPEIHSKNAFLRQAAERLAVNTPLQGTNADLIKQAMIEIEGALQKAPFEAKMLLQIHDELLFEVADKDTHQLIALVKPIMEGVVQLKIPLVVDISIGKNWGEC